MRTRIIGLGNTILTDDGVGVYAARAVAARLGGHREVEVVETEVAGFALLELLAGWERVLLLDAIQFDDVAPGRVLRLAPTDLRTSLRLRSVHEIDLPSALALARHLRLPMPSEIVIFAIQAADARTFGERLTPEVAAAVPRVVEMVLSELGRGNGSGGHPSA